VKQRLISHKQT